MKFLFVTFFVAFFLFSCHETKEQDSTPIEVNTKPKNTKQFSLNLNKIFEAHGGIENWNKMNSLSFEVQNQDGTEIHTTNLKSRKSRIEGETFTLGFDGTNVWKVDPDTSFKGNPNFYYNLIFYFHAMPFIISDPGAFYTERKDVVFERETLGAIHIGFGRSVGKSPEDEYIIYYDKETFRMKWLAYTVTYSERKRSTDWHFVKYNEWLEADGLVLPKNLIWYEVNNDKPLKPSHSMNFSKISVSETAPLDCLFTAPYNAIFE